MRRPLCVLPLPSSVLPDVFRNLFELIYLCTENALDNLTHIGGGLY